MASRSTQLLIALAFLTFFDRALLPPLLPVIARDLGASVDSIGDALVGYTIAYAAAQLLWSVISIRVGRVRVLAISTGLAVVGIVISALAVTPAMLVIGRVVAGAALGATVPAVLTYFGDTLTLKPRAVAAANLAAGLSLGMTVGTVVASVLGSWLDWRWAFALAGVLGIVFTVLLIRLPEPPAAPSPAFFASLRVLARKPWVLGILALTALEGALLVGVLAFLPTALVEDGAPVIVAGVATSVFGLAVIACSQLLKPILRRWNPARILLIGGLSTAIGYALVAILLEFWTVSIAAVLLGLGWAFAHTQMQTWMTDAAAAARPVGMSLFAVALFGGGSLGAAVGNAAVPGGQFLLLFAISAFAAAAFAVGSAVARNRYTPSEQ
ncbi:putative MFS family arabinose efflux permease [Microcella alkaliphila]|uniref:Putative MFS family arabinose efflux permease n=2 Tax=Microcella TaxID=337004 RepID=A0A4Q7LRZ5_9MICO|nr:MULTISPECIES: MFS transporter [Microcella]RZS57311.1 putative MFS family arabinose efflux permease [Microcella putealis]RZT57396.1 putative MFS family arabinose efflux permease [Microcella alkaliphila]TQM19546.1 putative MFS family arabinose efflux permease [Microcella putealis]